MKRSNLTMLQGNLFLAIPSYTVPIILTSFLQLLFHAADLIVVGRFCGSISLAAVGATGSITNLLVNFFIGLSVGAGVTVAHGIGSRRESIVHQTVHTAIPVALFSGILLTVLGVTFSERLLQITGTPEAVLPLSAQYMKIYFSGVTFTMLYNFCASILRAAGDTKSPLIYLTFAGVVNVVLNLVFVMVLHMNVAGVALATAISQAISAVLVLTALMRRTDACKFRFSQMRIYTVQLGKILRIGLPAGIQSSLFSISNVLIQSSINSFGDTLMSGSAAASNIEGFIYATLSAFQQTAVNFVGQNTGARQYNRVKKSLTICLAATTVTGLVLGNLAYAFAPQLLSIYIPDSQEAIALGVLRMSFMCIPYFMLGLLDVTTGALRGLGASFTPMLISVLGVCGLRILWIYTIFQIPAFHTPGWLYFSYPLTWTITFLCQFHALVKVYRRETGIPLFQKI